MTSKRIPAQKISAFDDFQTPPEALQPLLKYIPKRWTIWEPAEGKGNLINALHQQGYNAHGSDIKTGSNFLTTDSSHHYDCIITNPPYSIKNEFLETCYKRAKPFALLMPITSFESETRQTLFKQFGVEVLFLNRRINFETPNSAIKKSSSWFATAWFTYGLNIGKQINFESMPERRKNQTLF